MICPVCESSDLEHVTVFRFYCRDCRAFRDNSMFCLFVFGEHACGVTVPGECSKTQRACRRFGNLVRFGGSCSPLIQGPTVPREIEIRLEALGIRSEAP